MIHYLVRQAHAYTLQRWIAEYSNLWNDRLRLVPYEWLAGWAPRGVFIFSDVERLTPALQRNAQITHRRAERAGCAVLNHPVESLRRYDLQKVLKNDFNVFRATDLGSLAAGALRFPVFLRDENDHTGALTPLLHRSEELAAAIARHPGALVVEFLETADEDGIYRKYSAMRIGAEIIPRHVLFSRKWMLKDPDLVEAPLLREEADYVRRNPHELELRRVFDAAQIEYGRIDYGLSRGRLQVWEINSNPSLKTAGTSMHPERQRVHLETAAGINAALDRLDAGHGRSSGPPVWCGFGWPGLRRARSLRRQQR